MVWIGRDIKDHLNPISPASCRDTFHQQVKRCWRLFAPCWNFILQFKLPGKSALWIAAIQLNAHQVQTQNALDSCWNPYTLFPFPTARWQISADSLNQASFQERKLWQELSSVIRPVGTGILIIFVLFKHRLSVVTNHQNKWHVRWRQQRKNQTSFILFVQGFYVLLLLGATKFPSCLWEERERKAVNQQCCGVCQVQNKCAERQRKADARSTQRADSTFPNILCWKMFLCWVVASPAAHPNPSPGVSQQGTTRVMSPVAWGSMF